MEILYYTKIGKSRGLVGDLSKYIVPYDARRVTVYELDMIGRMMPAGKGYLSHFATCPSPGAIKG